MSFTFGFYLERKSEETVCKLHYLLISEFDYNAEMAPKIRVARIPKEQLTQKSGMQREIKPNIQSEIKQTQQKNTNIVNHKINSVQRNKTSHENCLQMPSFKKSISIDKLYTVNKYRGPVESRLPTPEEKRYYILKQLETISQQMN